MVKITSNTGHKWQFARVGGIDRVCIEKGEDIVNLQQLDQKLWTALSSPIYGLELDSKTLELIDSDADERIRVFEVLAAIEWICSIIKNPDDLLKQSNIFPISAINTETEEGKKLFDSARQILHYIGQDQADTLSVEITSDTHRIFADTLFNGDGIIIKESTDNNELADCIQHIMDTVGKVIDRSGKEGINLDLTNSFFDQLEKYQNWKKIIETQESSILPFGNESHQAKDIFDSVKSKIEDYFVRCQLAEFDKKSSDTLNELVKKYESISEKNLNENFEELATLPLAITGVDKDLDLYHQLNPYWKSKVQSFRDVVFNKLFPGKKELKPDQWEKIKIAFEAYDEWMNAKPVNSIETLNEDFINTYLSGNYKLQIEQLIEKDLAVAEEANSISKVDKLVRLYRDLYTLLKNFVSFSDFYDQNHVAIFQAGTLYIDRRSCDLCIKVGDIGSHSKYASQSGIYLMYCHCVSKKLNKSMNIVAALTNGDIDNLSEGRNGVFYDRDGVDWDATIVKIIDNPVSIRQAFWAPYRKINKMIGSQIEKFAADKNKSVHEAAATKIENHPMNEQAKEKPKPIEPFDIGKFVGIFAAIAMAIGAIGTAIVAVFSGFFNLKWWQMPLAVAGLMLAVSGPSMILAYLKLRKRNLAPLLDANGWAINAKATINIYFGRTLTHLANLPVNSERNLKDPYSQKKFPYIPVILGLLIIAFALLYFGCQNTWFRCPVHWFDAK